MQFGASAGSIAAMAKKRFNTGRDELLAAAAKEFAAHGFAGASTAGIARRALVTQPLVHHHFGSKQGVWKAVVDELFGGLSEELAEVQMGYEKEPTERRLSEFLRAFVRFTGRHPELSRIIRVESAAGGEAFEYLHQHWLRDLMTFVDEQLALAVEEGLFRKVDPRYAWFAIIGASTEPFVVEGTAFRRGLTLDEPEQVDAYAEFVVEFVMRALRKPGRRASSG